MPGEPGEHQETLITTNDSDAEPAEPSDKDYEDLKALFADLDEAHPATVHDEGDKTCPVCGGVDLGAVLESDSLLITALEAMFTGNRDMIKSVAEQLSGFDAHRAVTMLAVITSILCQLTGTSREEFIAVQREAINAGLAEHLASTTPSEAADGTGAEGDPGA